jgi:hypothetical protein
LDQNIDDPNIVLRGGGADGHGEIEGGIRIGTFGRGGVGLVVFDGAQNGVAQRGVGKKQQFLIKWRGYPLWEATWERVENLENSKQKLKEFHQRVESGEKAGVEQLTAIFKGVESVTVQSGHAEKVEHGVERLKQWITANGISVLSALQGLLDEL